MDFQIKSKYYVSKSNKSIIISIIVNIVVVIASLGSLLDIFLNGASISNVSSVIIALSVSILYKKKAKVSGHYESCTAKVQLTRELLSIYYEKVNTNIQILITGIDTIEYSDRLQCLRIVENANYVNQNNLNSTNKENLLYIESRELNNFQKCLEDYSGKRIVFVDRSS